MTTRTVSLNRSLSLLSWWRVCWVFHVFVILALGTLPIIGTYPIFSHTYDEPSHIAAGMELLDRGAFTYEQQHPPLARLAVALGPYLLAARSHGASYIIDEGLAIPLHEWGLSADVACRSAGRASLLYCPGGDHMGVG